MQRNLGSTIGPKLERTDQKAFSSRNPPFPQAGSGVEEQRQKTPPSRDWGQPPSLLPRAGRGFLTACQKFCWDKPQKFLLRVQWPRCSCPGLPLGSGITPGKLATLQAGQPVTLEGSCTSPGLYQSHCLICSQPLCVCVRVCVHTRHIHRQEQKPTESRHMPRTHTGAPRGTFCGTHRHLKCLFKVCIGLVH